MHVAGMRRERWLVFQSMTYWKKTSRFVASRRRTAKRWNAHHQAVE